MNPTSSKSSYFYNQLDSLSNSNWYTRLMVNDEKKLVEISLFEFFKEKIYGLLHSINFSHHIDHSESLRVKEGVIDFIVDGLSLSDEELDEKKVNQIRILAKKAGVILPEKDQTSQTTNKQPIVNEKIIKICLRIYPSPREDSFEKFSINNSYESPQITPLTIPLNQPNQQEELTASNQQENLTDTNQQEDLTDTNQQEELTASNQQEDLTDTNQQENLTDTNQQEELTDTNQQENLTDTNQQENLTDTNQQEDLTDTNLQEDLTDTNQQEDLTDTNLQEELTGPNQQEELTASNQQEDLTDTNQQEELPVLNLSSESELSSNQKSEKLKEQDLSKDQSFSSINLDKKEFDLEEEKKKTQDSPDLQDVVLPALNQKKSLQDIPSENLLNQEQQIIPETSQPSLEKTESESNQTQKEANEKEFNQKKDLSKESFNISTNIPGEIANQATASHNKSKTKVFPIKQKPILFTQKKFQSSEPSSASSQALATPLEPSKELGNKVALINTGLMVVAVAAFIFQMISAVSKNEREYHIGSTVSIASLATSVAIDSTKIEFSKKPFIKIACRIAILVSVLFSYMSVFNAFDSNYKSYNHITILGLLTFVAATTVIPPKEDK